MNKLFLLTLVITIAQITQPICVCLGGTKYGSIATKEMAWHSYANLEEALEHCTGNITCGPEAESLLPQKAGTFTKS